MYDQVQGDSMKNKLLFMMLTILGVPGIATATNYDLARSEYNFAVNELSKSSFNQAAIIGQVGTDNSAGYARRAQNYCPLSHKKGEITGRELTRQGIITLHILSRRAMPMMQVYRKVLTVIVRLLSRKVLGIKPILPNMVRKKQQL